jgi:hypothetical protein
MIHFTIPCLICGMPVYLAPAFTLASAFIYLRALWRKLNRSFPNVVQLLVAILKKIAFLLS